MKKILLASPHMCGKEIEFVNEAFETNWIAPVGPHLQKFEEEVCSFVQAPYSLAVSSGTSAIHLALKLLGVKKFDTVFCSSLTFAASANPIVYQNAKPVFIDSEKDTWNMCPKALLKAFKEASQLPKAVIVVHLYGQSAKMDEIKEICDYYKVPIIEDAAESLGSTYKGIQTGTIGDFGIFSFNGNKIITTSGGGMLLSKKKEMIEKAKFLSTQARESEIHYEHKEIGYNYRMSNVSAGIGRGQLTALNERIAKKKWIFEQYEQAFDGLNLIKMMPIEENNRSNYWLSCATLAYSDPVKLVRYLEERGIEARPIWKPLHLQPVFKEYNFFSYSESPVCEEIYNKGICLPSDTNMTNEDIEEVIHAVLNFLLLEVS